MSQPPHDFDVINISVVDKEAHFELIPGGPGLIDVLPSGDIVAHFSSEHGRIAWCFVAASRHVEFTGFQAWRNGTPRPSTESTRGRVPGTPFFVDVSANQLQVVDIAGDEEARRFHYAIFYQPTSEVEFGSYDPEILNEGGIGVKIQPVPVLGVETLRAGA